MITHLYYTIALFTIGSIGMILQRNSIIIVLMSIELILLSVNFNFIVFSAYLDDIVGQVFSLFVLTVAAAESAIGLAILVVYYRVRGTIAMETAHLMQGLQQDVTQLVACWLWVPVVVGSSPTFLIKPSL